MGLTRAVATLEGEPELLEREQFVAILEQSFLEAQSGEGRLVLVGGEGGIGKTALVDRFCRTCVSARVLWGRCDALLTPRPLGPFADMAAVSDGALAEAIGQREKPAGCLAALVREPRRTGRRLWWSRICTGRTRPRSTCSRCSAPACAGSARS